MSIEYTDFVRGAINSMSANTFAKAVDASQSSTATSTASAADTTTATSTTGKTTFAELVQELIDNTEVTCPNCGKASALGSLEASYSGSTAALVARIQSLLDAAGSTTGSSTSSSSTGSTSSTGTKSSMGTTSSTGNLSSTSTLGSTSSLSKMNISWPRGQDVSGWKQTVAISNLSVANGKISWKETGARDSWDVNDGVNGNAWIIQKQSDGTYSAQTWEYLRKGQTTKSTENIESREVMDDPPKSGDRVGIMVAGITRNSKLRNVEERSNVQWITWP